MNVKYLKNGMVKVYIIFININTVYNGSVPLLVSERDTKIEGGHKSLYDKFEYNFLKNCNYKFH